MITLSKPRIFRETAGVRFHDISIPGSNGVDLVEHTGPSVSPPNTGARNHKQWYVHRHQDDNNRVIKGHRLFELYYARWQDPHWFVMLDETSGALHIPAGCLHRSYSGNDGSLLLNHAVRDTHYDETKEFHPVRSPLDMLFSSPRYHNTTAKEVHHFINHGEVFE